MHHLLAPPKNWEGILPSTQEKLPSEPGKYYDYTIWDLLGWTANDTVGLYPHNRGGENGPKFGATTVKSVSCDFHHESLGEITFCLLNDELRNRFHLSSDVKAVITDGHGRTIGLYKGYYNENIAQESFKQKISIHIIPADQFDSVYTYKNVQSSQSATQTIGRPDGLFGSIIHEKILPLLSEEGAAFFRAKRGKILNQLAYLIYAFHMNHKKINFVDAFCQRVHVKKLSYLGKDAIKLNISDSDCRKIARALNFYAEFLCQLEKDILASGVSIKDYKGVEKSGPFFGLIAADYISDSHAVLPKNKRLDVFLSQCKRNLSDLVRKIPAITHGRKSYIEETIQSIGDTVRAK